MLEVCGEKLVERTIRLLKENGITDIAISTNNPAFDYLDVEKIRHNNNYIHDNPETNLTSQGCWLNAYCLMDKPCCYLHGDVYWSENGIKQVIETPVKNTMFFCVADANNGKKNCNIKGQEPLAYKVQNNKIFNNAVKELKQMIDDGMFKKDPISWHVYRKINNVEMEYTGFGNNIFHTKGDYITIDDYTTDIDMPRDIPKLEQLIKFERGEIEMVKVVVLENFHLGEFNKLKNLERKTVSKNTAGYLYKGDIFECTDGMKDYLTKTNSKGRAFVKVIEIIPEKKQTEKVAEEKPKRITRKRKSVAKK